MFQTPIPVSYYEGLISKKIIRPSNSSQEYVIIKNICYNIQYLDMLNQIDSIKYLPDNNLHIVYRTMNIKTFIITATSIIEAILFYELKTRGKTKDTWQKVASFSNPIDDETKIDSIIYKKGKPFDKEMKLDQMKEIAQNEKIFGDDNKIYGYINTLRKLRNKIHLHIGSTNLDTDWNKFNKKDFQLCQESLGNILKLYFNITDYEFEEKFKFLISEEK
ncbi:MAG: hypothetical protein PHR61_01970 [Candidatus Absconditabacteria bacterium]|nr:hypothetical protein [Candidatus Absconditabacteria bacterium]